jgi:hypothetical protein
VNQTELVFEAVAPEPENFIKSIAEQGYRLETAIADLIDNSISADADKVEILLDTDTRPFTLYIADNGSGMDEETLKAAMRFPSTSMEMVRHKSDLGRFGLGLKTSSFSQTRCFSVISRKKGTDDFSGRTWDIELLRRNGWVLKVESDEEIADVLSSYETTSGAFLSEFDGFEPNTIVVWKGLHKFEDYIKELNCADVLKKELTETTKVYLSLVFHRIMERRQNGLKIRLNNARVEPFNPFPAEADGVRRLGMRNRRFDHDAIKVEGFVLPTNSIDEVKAGSSFWTPPGKSLSDMEGIYIYRADRIILFGGWLELGARSQKMQLARMRVEIGNAVDHLLHLNISKSQVEMPHDIREGMRSYVATLRAEAEREYLNRTVRSFGARSNTGHEPFILTKATNRGAQMNVNPAFPLVQSLSASLDQEQMTRLKGLIRMFNTQLNSIRRVHEDTVFAGTVEDDGLSKTELLDLVVTLLGEGLEPGYIKSSIIGQLGFTVESLPPEVDQMLDSES